MMRVCAQDCSDSQKLPRDGLFSWEKTTRLHFTGMLMTWGVYQEWNLMTKDEILNAGFEGRARQKDFQPNLQGSQQSKTSVCPMYSHHDGMDDHTPLL